MTEKILNPIIESGIGEIRWQIFLDISLVRWISQ